MAPMASVPLLADSPAHSSLLRLTCSLVPPATSLPQARAAAKKDALLVMTFRDQMPECIQRVLAIVLSYVRPQHGGYLAICTLAITLIHTPQGSLLVVARNHGDAAVSLGGVYSRAGPSRGEQGRGGRLGGDSRGCCEGASGR